LREPTSIDTAHIAGRQETKTMNTRRIIIGLLVCGAICTVAPAQALADDPDALLKQALRYGDLYNWADAASLFTQAEQLYSAHGDSRNALYAHFGRLRSTMEQLSLPEISHELGVDLDNNPLLQSDNELRLFCLIVRGDIDGEIDAVPMRRDWEEALKVAQTLGDKKWENRASGEIGFSLFLAGDVTAARQKVTAALIGATMLQDAGAQIRYLAAIGHGFVQLGSYEDALGYFDKALKIAAANPDSGYQFVVNEGRLQAFRSMGKLDAAQDLADEIIAQARAKQKHVKETQALITASTVATAKNDEAKAVEDLQAAIDLAQRGGFTRLLADAQFYLEDIYRKRGDLPKAESLAAAAAEGTQSSGDIYLLPLRLQALAQLQASQGKYREASETYDRASDILDSMIGNVTSAQAKIGLITSMSAIYSEHFTLIASHLNNTSKAFSVLEHARGRVTTDLLMSGRPPDSPKELDIEKQIARLNLALTKAKSTDQVRKIRDEIFLVEEARWLAPGSNPWKSRPWETIPLERVRKSLALNQMMLEYVLAVPQSYCLAITKDFARIVPLSSREDIDKLVSEYLKILKTKGTSKQEGARLYAVLLKGIPEASSKVRLIVVPDGSLHLLPFEALVDTGGHYMVSSHTITYAPSATALYLMHSIPPRELSICV